LWHKSLWFGFLTSLFFFSAHMHEVWSVLLELEALGAHLGFRELMRLARINRQFRRIYSTAWPTLWRARRNNSKADDFRRILQLAVKKSAAEHVRVLIGDVTNTWWTPRRRALLCQRMHGQTYLHIAVRMQAQKPSARGLEVVRALVHAGGRALVDTQQRDLESRSRHKASVLHIAAQGDCVLTTQALLAVNSETLLMHCTDKGESCLHLGAAVGSLAVLHKLITAGGLPLALVRDIYGNTSLHVAAFHGRLAVVDELVEVGGQELLARRNDDGATSLFLAAQGGHIAVVNRLAQAGGLPLVMTPMFNGTSCLGASVINGHLEVVVRLLQLGGRALVLLQLDGGSSCLHLAAFHGRAFVVQALLGMGGRELVLMRFRGGSSALHIAAREGHVEVVQQLFDVGGPELLMFRDKAGRTGLWLAAQEGTWTSSSCWLPWGGGTCSCFLRTTASPVCFRVRHLGTSRLSVSSSTPAAATCSTSVRATPGPYKENSSRYACGADTPRSRRCSRRLWRNRRFLAFLGYF
jgi:ankyrin repeat protein